MKFVVSLICAGVALVACQKNNDASSVKSAEEVLYKKSLNASDENSLQGQLYAAMNRYMMTPAGASSTALKVEGDKIELKAGDEAISCKSEPFAVTQYSCDVALKAEEMSYEKDANSIQAVLFNAIAGATNQVGAEYVGLSDSTGNSIVCYKQSYGYSCTMQLPSAVDNSAIEVKPNTTEEPTVGGEIPVFQ